MLKSILVGLDGSAHAQSAMELGFQWARRFNALLVGIGIVDAPEICKPEAVPIGGGYYKEHADEVRLQRARRQVEHFLESFALRCMDAGVTAKLLEDEGLPFQQILLEAQRFDIILLGQKTHFQFGARESPDETLKKVLRQAPRPVVVVPEELNDDDSIVIAYDGSLQAARTLLAFEATGLAEDQKVHLVSVAPQFADASRHVERAAEFFRWHDIGVKVHALASSAPPVEVIMEQVEKLKASLVVMGCYGQPALREFFLGSVTRTMLQQSKVPLFLYH